MRLLVVEDDVNLNRQLVEAFQEAEYAVDAAADGIEGHFLGDTEPYDAVVLDIGLPGMDGIAVLKEIRRDPRLAATAVIMLTAKGEEMDRVVGLELGADDYVVKPFSSRELVLRAKSLLSRVRAPQEEHLLRAGNLLVDTAAHRVTVDGVEVSLTATEFKLLRELLRHKGVALSRDRLLESVWDYAFDGYARTVDTHMRRLRQKLGGAADAIETLRGVGYRYKG